jgi:hypothetical protein
MDGMRMYEPPIMPRLTSLRLQQKEKAGFTIYIPIEVSTPVMQQRHAQMPGSRTRQTVPSPATSFCDVVRDCRLV